MASELTREITQGLVPRFRAFIEYIPELQTNSLEISWGSPHLGIGSDS
jgi:hypothetical protein